MQTQQKALIVTARPGKVHGLDELNIALQRGWHVVHVAPMGGAGAGARPDTAETCFAALVIIERSAAADLEALALEEEIEETPGDVVDGDGAGLDIEDL